MIRVLVVDDNPTVRHRYRMLLAYDPEVQVIGEASDGEEAVRLTRETVPDLVLMDISMTKVDGLQATRQIRELGGTTRVLIVSLYASEVLVTAAVRQGAAGYLLKQYSIEELLPAIRTIWQGGMYLSPEIEKGVLSKKAKAG